MSDSQPQSSRGIGNRYWILVVVALILGLSFLFSFDFYAGSFRPDLWSSFISGVQISTLVVVVALVFLWARSSRREA